ncbi:MAG TPA: PepSY domain-containing protein [Gammaproteobacteria bacterium]|nr:PepSY domain-containing protein [Gammaproteobacteria bacterium]
MSPATLRKWSLIHTWTSLVCTLFLFMLCLTGLPLIFHDEIDAALNPEAWTPARAGGELLSLDAILARALAERPQEVPLFMSFDEHRPVVNVTTGPSPDAPAAAMHFASYDRTSGAPVPSADRGEAVMHFLLQLHTDMFLGLPGMLFLGAMGLLFVLAVVSGVVLYAPFMRRLRFGTVRAHRSARLQWLDWHNLTGIVALAWMLVVGLTGTINTLADPITELWKRRELADLVAAHRDAGVVLERASLEAAVAAAVAAAPDRVLQFVAFPGGAFSTARHYAIFLHGATPLTSHLLTPALVDAATGELAGVREMPWYFQALALSRPLHFGDYGGLPLKLLWAALTAITLVVLGSGLYLWVVRRGSAVSDPAARIALATDA